MGYGIKLHCWGEWACFTRPEMKVVCQEVFAPLVGLYRYTDVHEPIAAVDDSLKVIA